MIEDINGEYFYLDYRHIIEMNLPNVYGLIDDYGHASVGLGSHNIAIAINYWI